MSGPVGPLDQRGVVHNIKYKIIKFHEVLVVYGPLGPAGPNKNIISWWNTEQRSSKNDRETIHSMAQQKKLTVTLTVGEESGFF